MSNCTNCGNVLSEDSVFCPVCGHKKEEQAVESQTFVNADNVAQEVTEVSSEVAQVSENIKNEELMEEIGANIHGQYDSTPAEAPVQDAAAQYSAPTPPMQAPMGGNVADPSQAPHQMPTGEWGAPPIIEQPKKSGKGKIIAIIAIALVVLLGVAALLFIKLPSKSSSKAEDPIVYIRDDGVVKYLGVGKKTPVTICDDFYGSGEYYSVYGDALKVNNANTEVSYINDYDELYSIPVKEMTEDDHPSNRDYKVDSEVESIFGYDNSGKHLYYQNTDGDLMAYDGKNDPIKVDRDVVRLIVLDNDDILYMRGDSDTYSYDYSYESVEVSIYLETMSKSKPVKTKVANSAVGMYNVYVTNQGKDTKIYYATGESDEFDINCYNVKKDSSEVVIKRAAYIHDISDNAEILYNVEAASDMVDIHFYSNGEGERIVRDAINVYNASIIDNKIVYLREDGDDGTLVYQTLKGEAQDIVTVDSDHSVEVVDGDGANGLAVLVKDLKSSRSDSGELTHYAVSDRGVVGESTSIDYDVLGLYYYTVSNEFIYFKNPDSSGMIVDVYSTDGKDKKEIARDVDVVSVGGIRSSYDEKMPLFYIKDMDSRREYGSLAMYYAGKETFISDDVSVISYTLPIFYQSDSSIYLLKDYSTRRETADLYVYKGKDKVEIVDYDVTAIFSSYSIR